MIKQTVEQSVIDAVEQFVYDRHGSIYKSDDNLGFDEDQLERMKADQHGEMHYTVSAQIDETRIEDDHVIWYVATQLCFQTRDQKVITTDIDVYSCYQGEDGSYIIEWSHS